MTIYVLCSIIVLQSIIHHFERRDLYNRIMSKNLTEYKGDKHHSIKSAHDRVIRRWKGLDGENK